MGHPEGWFLVWELEPSPCGRVERLTVTVHGLFQIANKVFVQSGRRTMRFRQRQGFGEQPARMRPRGTKDGYRMGVILDDDLGAFGHALEQRGKITCRFRLRDVDDIVGHTGIIAPPFEGTGSDTLDPFLARSIVPGAQVRDYGLAGANLGPTSS